MTDQELIQKLREHAEWAAGNEWETPLMLGDDLTAAADRLANQNTHIAALQKAIEDLRAQLDLRRCALCDYWLGETDPRCMCGKSPWGGKTTAKDHYCSHWERHTDWIPVAERLPKDRSDVLVVAYWHERWGVHMGWCVPERGKWSVHVGFADRSDLTVTRWMPLPEPPEVVPGG